MMDAAELGTRAYINDVLARYARGVDRLDLDIVLSCFHPDAIDEHGADSGHPADIFPIIFQRLSGMEATMHFIGRSLIDFVGPQAATVETYAVGYHRVPTADRTVDDVTVGLRYIDVFEERQGNWRIAHRRLAVDWSRVDPVGSQMNLAAFVPGTRNKVDISYRPSVDSMAER